MVADLGLEVLFEAMAGQDDVLQRVARSAVLNGVQDCDTIRYRQAALADAIAHPESVRNLHDFALATLREERQLWGWFGKSPEINLHHAISVMTLLAGKLRELRRSAAENLDSFSSPAFRGLFARVLEELDDGYFTEMEQHLARLRFRSGILLSAGLGKGLSGMDYVLRVPPAEKGLVERLLDRTDSRLRFDVHPRDESGNNALDEVRSRGINLVADALSQSSQHVLGFFGQLRAELAFYVCCLNLRDKLEARGCHTSLPSPHLAGDRTLHTTCLYDPVLALTMSESVVPNDLSAPGVSLLFITGANRGGKSTFLRALGLAQLMTQAGMFAPAREFSSSIASGLFTHFTRNEDQTMDQGKLEEELGRMSRIVDHIRPGAILLCNETFSSTNEREASEIGDQVLRALTGAGIRVFIVTHLFDLARRFQGADGVLCLRAERLEDGTRTFKLREGAPLATSFGRDIFDSVFDQTT
ncbi:MAG: MutS-related protein [Candidatus Dormibacteria bacterium]